MATLPGRMEVRLSFLRLQDVRIGDQGTGTEEVACMDAFTGREQDATKVICGGLGGSFRVYGIQNETLVAEQVFVARATLPDNQGGTVSRAVTAPVGLVKVLADGSDRFLFTLWQSEYVFLAKFGDSRVISLSPSGHGHSGAVESLALIERADGCNLVAFGTDSGNLMCCEIGGDELYLGNPTGFQVFPDDSLVLFSKQTHGEGQAVSAVSFVGSHDKLVLASAGHDGMIRLWANQENDGGGKGWMQIACVEVEKSPIQALSACTLGTDEQRLLVSGDRHGSVNIWDVDNILTERAPLRLATLGNYTRDEIHCVHFVVHNEEELVLIVGDDAGNVTTYLAPMDTNNTGRLPSVAWRLGKRSLIGSPVVSISLLGRLVAVASCEKGIVLLQDEAAMEESSKELLEEVYDSEDELTPEPLPSPAANFTTSETLPPGVGIHEEDFASSPLSQLSNNGGVRSPDRNRDTTGLQVRFAPTPQEYPEYPDSDSESELSETCYNGYIDQDTPPLPLSRYHEPSLNSSEKIRMALEKMKLKTFPGTSKTSLENELSHDRDPALATRVLTLGRNERLYHDLTPIVQDIKPIVLPKRSVRPKNRKSILQRQQEEIEKHRLQRLAKLAADFDPADASKRDSQQSRGRKMKSPSPLTAGRRKDTSETSCGSRDVERPPPADHREATDQAKSTEDAAPWLSQFSLPWTRDDFYLSKFEDGKIGFHNFRSLGPRKAA